MESGTLLLSVTDIFPHRFDRTNDVRLWVLPYRQLQALYSLSADDVLTATSIDNNIRYMMVYHTMGPEKLVLLSRIFLFRCHWVSSCLSANINFLMTYVVFISLIFSISPALCFIFCVSNISLYHMTTLSKGAIIGSMAILVTPKAFFGVWLHIRVRIFLDFFSDYFFLLLLSYRLLFLESAGARCDVIYCWFELLRVG